MKSVSLIAAGELERETGLGRDLLRKWRSRYGFPSKIDSQNGEHGYSREQVAQLRLIRRLLDSGFRPHQVVGKSQQELEGLAAALVVADGDFLYQPFTLEVLELLKSFDLDALDRRLAELRAGQALQDFVELTVAPLLVGVGQAWAKGEIEVYHEHLCSNVLIRRLYLEIASVSPKPAYPRIVFATPAGEQHVLGLLMAQAVLADRGAHCINLGAHIPPGDLKMAVLASQADIVALSFSFAFPKWRVRPCLEDLRDQLPMSVKVWAGGAGSASIKRPPGGVRIFSDLREAALEVQAMTSQDKAAARPRKSCRSRVAAMSSPG